MSSHGWIFAAAGYNMALAVFHVSFWRIFHWREQLPKLHPVNRGVMQVMNIMLTFMFLSVAVLQVGWADDVGCTPLGRALLVVLFVFWLLRAVLQPLFWKTASRATNWGFMALFLVGAGLHLLALGLG